MQKTLRNKLVLFLFFLFPVLFFSCIENELDFDGIKGKRWAAQWAVPLVSSNLVIYDFLNDSSNIFSDSENGILKIIYESDELVSIRADEVTEIPDHEKTEQKNIDLPNLPVGLQDSISLEFEFTFELEEEGLRVDSMILKSGFYHFISRTDIDRDVSSIVYTVPNFIHLETNQPLRFEMDINSSTSGISETDTLLDLSLYKLKFEHTFTDTNTVIIDALVKIVGDNNPNNSPYFIEITNEFFDIEFLQFFGYIGHKVVEIRDTLSLDIFDIDQVGNFEFSDESVDLTINVNNSFGLPVRMDVSSWMAYNDGLEPDSVEIFLFGEGEPAEFDINSPEPEQIGESVHTEVFTDNSNMYEALSILPNKLYLEVDALLNPDSMVDQNNFILDSNTINTSICMDLKLFGSIDGFQVLDTVEFNLQNANEFESLFFVAEIENYFPVTTLIKLDFVDSLYQVVYTLFPDGEPLTVAAGVGSAPDYRVVSPTTKLTEVELMQDELELLADARKILLTATLSTEEGQEVKFYADYKIVLKLGAKVGIYY